jgi:hypothetical protein
VIDSRLGDRQRVELEAWLDVSSNRGVQLEEWVKKDIQYLIEGDYKEPSLSVDLQSSGKWGGPEK